MARIRTVDLGSPFIADLTDVCEVLLVRHGEQNFTKNMPIADGVDAPLTELGQRQAEAVGERLAGHAIDAVYSSPLVRAADTGDAIAKHHGLDVPRLDDLSEINLWHQLPQEQGLLDSLSPDELRAIMREGNRTRLWASYPYCEPRDPFRDRVVAAIDRIIADHHGDRVVVACHGGVINAYLAHISESPLDQMCSLHHTSISVVRGREAQRRTVQVNDFAHVLSFQNDLNPLNAL